MLELLASVSHILYTLAEFVVLGAAVWLNPEWGLRLSLSLTLAHVVSSLVHIVFSNAIKGSTIIARLLDPPLLFSTSYLLTCAFPDVIITVYSWLLSILGPILVSMQGPQMVLLLMLCVRGIVRSLPFNESVIKALVWVSSICAMISSFVMLYLVYMSHHATSSIHIMVGIIGIWSMVMVVVAWRTPGIAVLDACLVMLFATFVAYTYVVMIPVVKAGEDTSYLTKIVQANAQLWASAYEHVDISHYIHGGMSWPMWILYKVAEYTLKPVMGVFHLIGISSNIIERVTVNPAFRVVEIFIGAWTAVSLWCNIALDDDDDEWSSHVKWVQSVNEDDAKPDFGLPAMMIMFTSLMLQWTHGFTSSGLALGVSRHGEVLMAIAAFLMQCYRSKYSN